MAVQLSRTDTLTRAAILALKQVAQDQNFPEARLKAMRFQIECSFDVTRYATVLRMQWRDPDGDGVRGLEHLRTDTDLASRDPASIFKELKMAIEQINLRGELFYFKLHRHFPNRIEAVVCDRQGRVTVKFKNGRSLTTNEADLDSTEFLATCGMVYDL